MGPSSGLFVFTAPTIEPTRFPNTGPFSVPFTVSNTGTSSIPGGDLTCQLTGPVTCGTVTPSFYPSLAPGASMNATVTYTVGSVGSGSLGLVATPDIGNPASKSRTVTVANGGKARPSFVNYNPDNRDRSLCLTTGAGEAAGISCGDLFAAHAMPGYSTLGRDRSLTLYYNSAAATSLHLVAAHIAEPTTIGTPDKIKVVLTVGTSKDSAEYSSTLPYPYDQPRQVVLGRGLAAQATGVYPMTLLVRNVYPSSEMDTTITGSAIVVNRSSSEFGAGWWLAGVERLLVGQANNAILRVGGDGSAQVYDSIATGTWRAPPGAFRDTLRRDSGDTTYTRTLRHGIRVVYDIAGRHRQTINRTGQVTTFYWNTSSERLDSIAVPPAGQPGTVYRLTYDGNGKLDRITDPAGRILEATVTSGRLVRLVDPDTTYFTDFAYDAAGRLTGRTNRRGFTTTYAYAKGARLTKVSIPLDTATSDTAKTTFEPWDERGLATGYFGQTAVDTQTVYTQIDGPRTDVQDVAKFWIDRWGAPIQIVDPAGATTLVARGNGTVPALDTSVTYPGLPYGRVAQMTWNARGNLTQLRDSAGGGLPVAVSRWTYNAATNRDAPDSVIDPVGLVSRFIYDSLGFVSQAFAPNGHQTTFTVVPSGTQKGLVRAVVEVQVPVWDSLQRAEVNSDLLTRFGFNTLGNVVRDTSPLGRIRQYDRDAAQRVNNSYDPAGHRTELVYDALNRVRQTLQYHSDSGYASPLVTTHLWGIDALDSIVDPRGVARGFEYDAALRPKAERDDYNVPETRYFSRASQVDSVHPRAHSPSAPLTVRHTYDAVGRLLTTAWPARDPEPADTLRNTYDVRGRVLTATTSVRKLTRTYYATGALESEVQSLPTGASLYRHTYGYDAGGRRSWYVIGVRGDAYRSDSVTYVYDAASGDLRWIKVRWRLTTDAVQRRDSVQLWWDALGRRDSVVYSNGARLWFAYDKDGAARLVCGNRPQGGSTPSVYDFVEYHKGVNPDGLILFTKFDRFDDGEIISGCNGSSPTQVQNVYDSRHQLLAQTQVADSMIYRYDASGNRTVWRHLTTTSGAVLRDEQEQVPTGHNRLSSKTDVRYPNDFTTFSYDSNGARQVELRYVNGVPQGFGYRRYLYDGLGRTTGTDEYECIEWNAGGACTEWSTVPHTTLCAFDPVGRMHQPCDDFAPVLGFDGENAVRTHPDDVPLTTPNWTFIHGPGTDDPLMGFYTTYAGTRVYFMTDGQGRQYAVGDPNGDDCTIGSFGCGQPYQDQGGRYGGSTTNARSFGKLPYRVDN